MDKFTFISKIIESLAWPITVITLILILRIPLGNLLLLLRKLKYKDLELEFSEKLEQLEEKVEKAELPLPTPSFPERIIPGVSSEARKSLRQLAVTVPRAAIGEAWRQLEFAIRGALEKQGITSPRHLYPTLELARENKILPQNVIPLVADLRALRNRAVHGRNFTVDAAQALEYIDLSERVMTALSSNS